MDDSKPPRLLGRHLAPPALCLFLILIAFQPLSADSIENYKQVPIKEGDRCFICNIELVDGGVAFIYRGRRVTVASFHVQQFLDAPLKYFSRLQPRGALFQEDAILERPMWSGWLLLGIWLAVGLVSAAISTHLALRKGLPPVTWFAIGLATNLFGLLLLLRHRAEADVSLPPHLAKIPTTLNPVECPACRAENHPSAKQCSACGAQLNPTAVSEVERSGMAP